MALLDIKKLTKKYGNFTAIDNVSFQVNAGEIVALIGENGAGKTTILNCLAGSISVTEGCITYKAQSLLKKDSLRDEFGFLIQANFFEYMNAYDNLDILFRLSGQHKRRENEKEIMSLLHIVGLENKKNEFVKTFSFGMKQRLGLSQALINNPHFLVLDEPFVGLDPQGKKILKKVILEKAKKEKAGILFSSHDLEDVLEICDRVVMLKKGEKIYDDVFQTRKRYILCMEQKTDAKKLAANGKDIKQDQNNIICQDYENFQKEYRVALEEGMGVRDIEIEKDSLYQFFEGGKQDEDSGNQYLSD